MTALIATPDGFHLSLAGVVLLRHARHAPCVFAGTGEERIAMYRGNFDIADYLTERAPLAFATIDGALLHLRRDSDGPVWLTLELQGDDTATTLHIRFADSRLNRFWFRICAESQEHVWGGGEQMSYFDMRGRRFPLWTSEPGVGRDKRSPITFQADAQGHAGGDYYTTNYPQPTFVSSRCYAAHMETTAYSAFDFRHDAFHELEVWAAPERLEFHAAADFRTLVKRVSARFGRQPRLPDWLYNGAIIGLKSGADSFTRLETYLAAGTRVSALWCEDWAGVRQTSFGTRLFWDWRWNPARYTDLPQRIADLHARGIRFMGYVNPYLCDDGTLFGEAEALGLLARNAAGDTYRVDFGEFDCGVVDFTNLAARDWFAERILCGNMLELGLSGWMADFGEYLPIDARLANGVDARLMHNAWPTIWAEVNADAVARAGRGGDAVFFMRAGFTGVQRSCPLLWAGDQCVDFSRHDGLPSVICGALSSGLLGNAYHHSDIGGYTSLFGNVRTPELLQRWTEMAAFTPVMRTHEGNRPGTTCRSINPPKCWRILLGSPGSGAISRLTCVRCRRKPRRSACPCNVRCSWNFPTIRQATRIQDTYLYGSDLLVAPVQTAGSTTRCVHLPAGAAWRHLWSNTSYRGGARVTVPAPIGEPPVFFRDGSVWEELFRHVRDIA